MEWQRSDFKRALFGLANYEGNHGEDVKELYYYLDNLPTHTTCSICISIRNKNFLMNQLRTENRNRTKLDPEYEIFDTGVFNNNEYFDVLITYAKQDDEDIFIKIDITNRYH